MTEPQTDTAEPVEVHVAGVDQAEAARLLLEAADELGHDPAVVQTMGGGFLVPHDVAVKAGALDDAAIVEPAEGNDDGEQVEGQTAIQQTDRDDLATLDPADTPAGPPTDGVAEQPVDLTTEGEAPDTAAAAEGVAEEPEVLRGEALEQALKDRGLPTSGTADEKRARVAEHDAAQQ